PPRVSRGAAMPDDSSKGAAIWVARGDLASLAFATDVALTALVADDPVMVALFDAGAAGWIGALRPARSPTPEEPAQDPVVAALVRARSAAGWTFPHAVAQCRALGGRRFSVVACSGALVRLGVDGDALIEDG